jgi:hypothetical protein
MRRFAVLLTLILSFVVPLAIPAAHASMPEAVQERPPGTSCKGRRAKKPSSDNKSKKKGRKEKKPYGFEL